MIIIFDTWIFVYVLPFKLKRRSRGIAHVAIPLRRSVNKSFAHPYKDKEFLIVLPLSCLESYLPSGLNFFFEIFIFSFSEESVWNERNVYLLWWVWWLLDVNLLYRDKTYRWLNFVWLFQTNPLAKIVSKKVLTLKLSYLQRRLDRMSTICK